jgi:selenocysteine-specific elongation factor
MSLVVGVIGHVDHGKTALVRALTGEETDRLAEEKARGISIALGFAKLAVGDGEVIDLIDMPGHERFVRTMISGATGIDAVLLVVAANEGIKPQTIEHVEIAGLLGLRRAVIAVSKIDLVPPEQMRAVAEEAAGLLRRAGLTPLPPVFTSSVTMEGVEALAGALAGLVLGQAQKSADGLAFLPVDRAFAIPGHGPVVTGTLRGAAVAAGEVLELFPARKTVRVRAAQVRGARVEKAAPGQRVALNLRDVELTELARGMALAAPGWLAPSDWLTITVRAVAEAPPLKNGVQLRALLGTEEIGVRLRLLDADVLEPGQSGFAQLHCASPVAFPAREHVVLRLASPAQTVAGGRILEPQTRRLRRHSVPVLERLAKLRDLAPEALLLAEIETQGAAGTSLARLSQLSALAPAHITETLQAQPVLVARGGLVVAQAALEVLAGRIPALLAAQPDGLAVGRLLASLPGTSAGVLDEVIALLLARSVIVRRGALLSLPQPEAERARAAGEADLAVQIAALLRDGGLAPPDPRTVITSLAAKRAVDRLLREGVLVRAVDRGKNKEILFHAEAVEAAIRRLDPLLVQPPGLLATDVGAALGISRKYTMPLLDHLDAIRFTKRINDRRIRGTASLTVLLSAATNG